MITAKQLLENASYGPEARKIVFRAFNEAWNSIADNFGDDPPTIQMARVVLANAILNIPHDKITDVEQIKNSALQTMALLYRNRARAGPKDRLA